MKPSIGGTLIANSMPNRSKLMIVRVITVKRGEDVYQGLADELDISRRDAKVLLYPIFYGASRVFWRGTEIRLEMEELKDE